LCKKSASKNANSTFSCCIHAGARRMDDLIQLNRRIAEHWFGSLDPHQEAYVSNLTVCLGQLTLTATEFKEVVRRFTHQQRELLRIAKLNRRYLQFARLMAREAVAGKQELLIKLGVTLEQAEVLCRLTDQELSGVAAGWNKPLVHFSKRIFSRGSGLSVRAAKHHATAFVATLTEAKTIDAS